MSVTKLLHNSELFSGLTPRQIARVAALSRLVTYDAGVTVFREGDPSDEVYVIGSGMVEVLIPSGAIPDVPGPPQLAPIVRLGQGQVFGEMALVDRGARSATVRCIEDGTTLHVVPNDAFWALCDSDHHIGYLVMRNVASDLSFKLRHRNLQRRLAGGSP